MHPNDQGLRGYHTFKQSDDDNNDDDDDDDDILKV